MLRSNVEVRCSFVNSFLPQTYHSVLARPPPCSTAPNLPNPVAPISENFAMSQQPQIPSSPEGMVGTIIVIVGLIIGGAYLIDSLWTWFGARPFAVCAVMVPVDLILGKTVGLIVTFLGLVLWTLSGFQNTSALTTAVAGLFLGVFPQLFASYLGARCFG